MEVVVGSLIFFFVINFVIVIGLAMGMYTEYKYDRVKQYIYVMLGCWVWNLFGVGLIGAVIDANDVLVTFLGLVIIWIVGLFVAMRPE